MSFDNIKDIGQHLIIGMEGVSPTNEILSLIREYNIGGVLFLGKNYSSVEELSDTINMLQASSSKVPLLTTVDHEGGRVQRFKGPFTILPSYRELAKDKTPKQIFEIHALIAEQLEACGINMNFAPVADLSSKTDGVIGDRSIGTDLQKVEDVISATIRGFIKKGLLCCVKHFPGHGCVEDDSHIDLPVSNKTLTELMNYEIIPFRKATKANVSAIMMAHIMFPNIDELPSSFSSKLIQDIIRKEFRFTKLVITDDISMGAISKHYDIKDAIELSLMAGNDMIIFSSSDTNLIANNLDIIRKKVESNSELRSKIAEAQNRIFNIKSSIKRQNISASNALEVLNNSTLGSQI